MSSIYVHLNRHINESIRRIKIKYTEQELKKDVETFIKNCQQKKTDYDYRAISKNLCYRLVI